MTTSTSFYESQLLMQLVSSLCKKGTIDSTIDYENASTALSWQASSGGLEISWPFAIPRFYGERIASVSIPYSKTFLRGEMFNLGGLG